MCVLSNSVVSLCSPMGCSPPGSSVHGILQARILEWVATPSSRGSSQPRDQTQSPTLQVDSLPTEPPTKTPLENRDLQMLRLRDCPGEEEASHG